MFGVSRAIVALFLIVASTQAYSRVYRNIPIGDYEDRKFDLTDCDGKTFLQFMKDEIYPAIAAESAHIRPGQHIDGVKKGEGVELRLTSDVSTYHVKFKRHGQDKAERSGRSFSAVGNQKRPAYVADASYAHYLDSLDKIMTNRRELRNFYTAILGVVASCDASGFNVLQTQTKQVAADFVAVYIAEQYRHLLSGRGEKLGSAHNWDDALLQVTLLASFHAGQSEDANGMFYEGRFTDSVYNQIYETNGEKFCVYKQPTHPKRGSAEKRGIKLKDYWQFNKKCDRSGVNVTRADFTKMGSAITNSSSSNSAAAVSRRFGGRGNAYHSIARFFISNSAPAKLDDADELVEMITDFLMDVQEEAVDITNSL